jgi:excisionase family DNA binding protein
MPDDLNKRNPKLHSGSIKPQPAKRKRKLTPQEIALRYLVPKQTIADRYSVSPRTVEFWVRKRRIPCFKVGRELLFNIADTDKAVERFKRTAART